VIETFGERARYLDTFMEAAIRRNEEYLQRVAKTFLGTSVKCTVDQGTPEEMIIGMAAPLNLQA
jgi:hypothetical protein